ncbi:hypothetical protein V5O48_018801, partial [Marasmius crinis-equi]
MNGDNTLLGSPVAIPVVASPGTGSGSSDSTTVNGTPNYLVMSIDAFEAHERILTSVNSSLVMLNASISDIIIRL